MYRLIIESFTEYEGMIHETVTRYRIVGSTFAHNPFSAGPFQSLKEAEEVLEVLNKKGIRP